MTKLEYITWYENKDPRYMNIHKPKTYKDEVHKGVDYHTVVYRALKVEQIVKLLFTNNNYEVEWNDILYEDEEFHEDVFEKPDMYINGIPVEVKLISVDDTKHLLEGIKTAKKEQAKYLIYLSNLNKLRCLNLDTFESGWSELGIWDLEIYDMYIV